MLSTNMTCLVLDISDGDTLTARCDQPGASGQIKVRISAIGAPEKKQPFGERSKQNLSALCYKSEAVVMKTATERYGRTVADMKCGRNDVATEQVRAGMAWVYDTYAKGYEWLYRVQDSARTARTGLCADSRPTPPWEWRAAKKYDSDSLIGRAIRMDANK